jgi:hypothetical protein
MEITWATHIPEDEDPFKEMARKQPGITLEDVFGSVKTGWSCCTAVKNATGSALFGSAGSDNNNINRNQSQNRNNGQCQGQGNKQQDQAQGDQDGNWCHIHQSNLHDLKECQPAIERFGSKANTTTAPASAANFGTTVSSSVSSAIGQVAFPSALIAKTASPS